MPVATQATPSRSASSASQRLRARSRRHSGRCSSIRKRSAPEARRRAAARAPPPAAGRRAPRRPASAPSPGAAGEADEPLVALEQRVERQRRGEGVAIGLRAAVSACASVSSRQRLCQPVALSTSSVRWKSRLGVDDGELRADDRPHPEPVARLRELHRPADVVVVGEREGRIAVLGGAGGELLGQRGAVAERVRGVGVELYVHRGYARCSNQREASIGSAGSRKTTTLRPSASTTSK